MELYFFFAKDSRRGCWRGANLLQLKKLVEKVVFLNQNTFIDQRYYNSSNLNVEFDHTSEHLCPLSHFLILN